MSSTTTAGPGPAPFGNAVLAATTVIAATAIGATIAAPAEAAMLSTAGAGFTPVTVTTSSDGRSFDLDGDGTNDFTLAGDGSNISLRPLNAATSGAGSINGNLVGTTDPSSLAIGNVKTGTSVVIAGSNFNPGFTLGETDFAALAVNATFAQNQFGANAATSGTLGYLEGVLVDPSTFQLLDYGLIVADTPVPEPASLALLATGAAGIAALRRRRAHTASRAA